MDEQTAQGRNDEDVKVKVTVRDFNVLIALFQRVLDEYVNPRVPTQQGSPQCESMVKDSLECAARDRITEAQVILHAQFVAVLGALMRYRQMLVSLNFEKERRGKPTRRMARRA